MNKEELKELAHQIESIEKQERELHKTKRWILTALVVVAAALFLLFSRNDLPMKGAELVLAAAVHKLFNA